MIKKCLSCARSFTSRRADKRSCSEACRKALQRGSATRWVKGADLFGEFRYRVPRLVQTVPDSATCEHREAVIFSVITPV